MDYIEDGHSRPIFNLFLPFEMQYSTIKVICYVFEKQKKILFTFINRRDRKM